MKLNGESSISCNDNGVWSDHIPTCTILYNTKIDNTFGNGLKSGVKDDPWWTKIWNSRVKDMQDNGDNKSL
jgi:hypothetical protein